VNQANEAPAKPRRNKKANTRVYLGIGAAFAILNQSGLMGYFWVILLSCTIMAPLIVALPIAHSLSKKGARLQLVIAFLSASTICRIPMTVFEATYLGIPFTVVRLIVSLPLVIIFSELIGRFFSKEQLPA